jgi:putative DNA primase/helicase
MGSLEKDAVRRANPLEHVIPALLNEHPTESVGELKVRCPWHEDKAPSLRINPSKGVWHCDPCDIGGDVFAFVQRWHQSEFPEALAWLADRAGLTGQALSGERREVAAYSYLDETGTLLYQVVRFEPKGFRQRRPDGAGGWLWNLNGTKRVLYRLPDLKGREAVLIVEGEKDVDRAWAMGLPATCNAGGAGKWSDDYSRQLVACGVERVVVIPDHDGPGRTHADAVARSCQDVGLKVRTATLPDVREKGETRRDPGRSS